ncbi:GNAT family N-acetyltransferase [Saccharospirillum sp. HFRX-1]|uniref:GNAT family N-acetyltransferase n=1 Tax=unclassified Saccharospirillum TaxID=2633430 RepID=UPI00371529D2
MQALRTERCLITPYSARDLEGHRAIYHSAAVRRHLSWTAAPELDQLRELYIERAKRWQAHTAGSGAFSVRLHGSDDYVGLLLLKAMPYGDGEFSERLEIGWHLAEPYWGKGLATEAAQALLNYGFEVLKLETIWAVAVPDNKASLAVMERLGMRYVETTDRYYGEQGILYSISRAAD